MAAAFSMEKDKKPADNSGTFYEFQKVCQRIEEQGSYNAKTKILEEFFKNFSYEQGYYFRRLFFFKKIRIHVCSGDLYLFCRLMLCRLDKRVYNIRDKQLVKILSRYFSLSISRSSSLSFPSLCLQSLDSLSHK